MKLLTVTSQLRETKQGEEHYIQVKSWNRNSQKYESAWEMTKLDPFSVQIEVGELHELKTFACACPSCTNTIT
jgi:hypothetical protein